MYDIYIYIYIIFIYVIPILGQTLLREQLTMPPTLLAVQQRTSRLKLRHHPVNCPESRENDGHVAVCQNLVPLVNIKIAGKWMFIPLKMVLIGIDPYPCENKTLNWSIDVYSVCINAVLKCNIQVRCSTLMQLISQKHALSFLSHDMNMADL